jgi:branched-chain amino acid transport system substrate-binding protein
MMMSSERTRSRWAAIGVAAALVLVTAGCGSRLSTEEIRAGSVVEGSSGSGTQTGDAVTGEGATDGEVAGPGEATTDVTAAAGEAAAGDPAAPSGAAATAAKSGPKSPIVIGYIGWLSGTGGETMSPTRDAWVAWSRAVNARGGINGHPVQLLVGDHGGNESRAVSIARDFVENKGAIALTQAAGGPAIGEYAKDKRIPVIGSVLTGGTWSSNPMLFPPFGSNGASSFGAARMIKRSGKTKVASVFCAESADCEEGSKRTRPFMEAEGLQVVSEQRYSVTAPDYTAECIQMRSAGAEVVFPNGDTGSMIRMAKACARQNFRPIWVAPTMDDSVASMPEFENAIAVTPVFPWFMRSGNPAIEEYAAAIGKYAPARLTKSNIFMSEAWLSAKLFEKAAAKVGDKPTSQEILDGLWAMKGETLGGLATGPTARTFTRDQPTPETFCVFDTKLVGGKWTAPSGLNPICR